MNTPGSPPFTARPNLRLADPRLPMTVSLAAIELDNASRGIKGTFESTRRFVRFLSDALNQGAAKGGAQPAMLDANTVDIVGHTLNEFEGGGSVKTVEDVFNHASRVLEDMQKVSAERHVKDLQRLRKFCVLFGNHLLSHHASLRQKSLMNHP